MNWKLFFRNKGIEIVNGLIYLVLGVLGYCLLVSWLVTIFSLFDTTILTGYPILLTVMHMITLITVVLALLAWVYDNYDNAMYGERKHFFWQ